MTLCLPLEMSLSKEVLWAHSLAPGTTQMTGSWGGWACLSDRQPEQEWAGRSRWPAPSATITLWTSVPCVSATEPSPITHLSKQKSTPDFHSLYLNFYGGGSHPAGGGGGRPWLSAQAPTAPRLSALKSACYQPDLFPGLGPQLVLSHCLLNVPVEFS